MSEMAERVGYAARVAALEFGLSGQMIAGQDPSMVRADVMRGQDLVFSGPIAECHAFINQNVGRAVLAAMRELSEREMQAAIVAGCKVPDRIEYKEGALLFSIDYSAIWRAMFDAALAEAPA